MSEEKKTKREQKPETLDFYELPFEVVEENIQATPKKAETEKKAAPGKKTAPVPAKTAPKTEKPETAKTAPKTEKPIPSETASKTEKSQKTMTFSASASGRHTLKKNGKIKISKPLLVGIIAIVLLLVIILLAECGIDRMKRIRESEEAEETRTEEPSESEAPTEPESIPDLPDFTVMDCSWQAAPGYTWRDMYVILCEITRTSGYLEEDTTCMAIFKTRYSQTPLLYIGGFSKEENQNVYHLFSFDKGNVYDLFTGNENLWYDKFTDSLVVGDDRSCCYFFEPNVLLKVEPAVAEAGDYKKVEMQVINSLNYYTSNNIDTIVMDLYKGGDQDE